MTLKLGDILFIAVLSLLTGVAGAMLHDRFLSPPPAEHKIVTFNPGAFVMSRMLEMSTNEKIYDSKDALEDSLRVVNRLAEDGYIVIESSAVLGAPRHYHLNPDEPAVPANVR